MEFKRDMPDWLANPPWVVEWLSPGGFIGSQVFSGNFAEMKAHIWFKLRNQYGDLAVIYQADHVLSLGEFAAFYE